MGRYLRTTISLKKPDFAPSQLPCPIIYDKLKSFNKTHQHKALFRGNPTATAWQAKHRGLLSQFQMTKYVRNNPLFALLSLFLLGACQDGGPLIGPDGGPAGKLVDLPAGVFGQSSRSGSLHH